MNLGSIASRLRAGETVTFVAQGGSMAGRVESGSTVTVYPVPGDERLEKGDVVLARVNGRWLLHLISGFGSDGRRVQISNNHGRVNGWTARSNVVGKIAC